MQLEIILICGLILSLQQLRIIDLKEDLNQWRETSLLNQRERQVKWNVMNVRSKHQQMMFVTKHI